MRGLTNTGEEVGCSQDIRRLESRSRSPVVADHNLALRSLVGGRRRIRVEERLVEAEHHNRVEGHNLVEAHNLAEVAAADNLVVVAGGTRLVEEEHRIPEQLHNLRSQEGLHNQVEREALQNQEVEGNPEECSCTAAAAGADPDKPFDQVARHSQEVPCTSPVALQQSLPAWIQSFVELPPDHIQPEGGS